VRVARLYAATGDGFARLDEAGEVSQLSHQRLRIGRFPSRASNSAAAFAESPARPARRGRHHRPRVDLR
jgi:hypothetical protein